jgi:hypothetical protein
MKLYEFIHAYPSQAKVIEYISFNIRTYYCVHERLIYYSNRDRIKFNQTEPSRIHEQLGSSCTPSHGPSNHNYLGPPLSFCITLGGLDCIDFFKKGKKKKTKYLF